MSKSPKGEASSVAFTNAEQTQEGNNERLSLTVNLYLKSALDR